MKVIDDELRIRIADADALRDSGKLDEALPAYQAIVAEAPGTAEGWYKLGTAFGLLQDSGEAERCYREALTLWSDFPQANNNLGLILAARGELDAAERHYRVALAEDPDRVEAHLNLGTLFQETGRLPEAQYLARRAMLLKPDSAIASDLLGRVKKSMGRISEAIQHAESAVELDPKFAAAWTNLGACYWNCGRHRDAERALSTALALAPDFLPAWNNLLLSSNYSVRNRDEVFRLHRSFGDIVRKQCGDIAPFSQDLRLDPDRRLRIGFISGDLRRHSVTYFLPGALRNLDRSRFQLFAYFNFRAEDEVTWSLKPIFHQWKSIFGLPDQKAADLIREDRIDILIDLAGHTASIRPLVLGRRPAPIQVHWIGYPNTTGLDCIDYRLTDHWADPVADGDRFSSEELWRLPASFLCYTPAESAPALRDPPCLAKGHVTFGSFNSRAKLSEECVALWCRVLLELPDAKLVLKSFFGADDDESRDGLKQIFVAGGIAPDRIEVRARLGEHEDHLAAYHDIDIALDSFPYNGTTTTCEALWMGVPVVTLAGDRHASRVGASLLNNVGLVDLVAGTPDDFVQIAITLASEPQTLKALRASMREHMRSSRLMDKPAMGADLGAALREMWQRHCATLPASALPENRAVEQATELMKLHIGGRDARAGWKILDATARPEVDFIGDVTNLEAFPAECCSDVYCSHVLEHVGQSEMLGTLNGMYRILAPGGRLYISVPDMEVLAWLFVNPGYGEADRFQIMRRIFGGQMDAFDFHKIGLYFDLMYAYLTDVGFASIEHVQTFDLFDDSNKATWDGHLISLNLIAIK